MISAIILLFLGCLLFKRLLLECTLTLGSIYIGGRLKKLFFLLVSAGFAFGQASLNAAGTTSTDEGGSISFSVGVMAYTTVAGEGGSLEQGVQHQYEISEVSTIREVRGITLSMKVFPNPTTDFLILNVGSEDASSFSYRLYDAHGKVLNSAAITTQETYIPMSQYVAALYFVKVFRNNREVKTFKVLKL